MKFRIILIVLFTLPILLKGQSDVIFYSEAPMHVKYKENEANKGESSSTTLYVEGSVKFSTGSSIEQKGRTEITKDFINAKDPRANEAEEAHLFVNKTNKDASTGTGTVATDVEGVVAFIGKGEDGKSTLQRIYGVIPEGSSATIEEQKEKNWIDFPTIAVEKGKPTDPADDWRDVGYLKVDVTGSLSVDYVKALYGDRFAVDMKYAMDPLSTTSSPRILNSGYALIKDVATVMKEKDKATYSQVNLELYKYDETTDDGAFILNSEGIPVADPNTYASDRRTLRNSSGWNYLTGITTPFQSLGADYMFYHALTKPHGSSITSYEGPIVDPYRKLENGVGYFISMEVSHNDHDVIDKRWNFPSYGGFENKILADNRARGGYVFNRMVFHDYLSKPGGEMNNFSRFYYDSGDHNTIHGPADRRIGGLGGEWIELDKHTGQMLDRSRYEKMVNETFNTSKTEVVVKLKQGLNFLGNPFMVPISMNPLLGYSLTGTLDIANMDEAQPVEAFTPNGGKQVMVSSDKIEGADLRSKYWLINEAQIKYDDKEDLFLFKAKYDYISREAGSTLAITGNNEDGNNADGKLYSIDPLEYLIAPMQMFCLQAAHDVDIKLDMNELSVFGKTHFLKNAEATPNNDIMRDWFVVEVKNEKENTADRMSVVFNDKAKSYYNNDSYDTRKGISEKIEEFVPEYNGERTKTKYEGSTGIIYTKSTDDQKLLGNAVPSNTKELGLFFMPPSSTEELTLRFYGVENLESVPGVWLIDRHLDKKIRIYPGDEYSFVSDVSTTKTYTADNNRFVLRFYDEEGDIIANEEKDIFCYYQGSSVYVTNLNEDDINSDIQLYDLQGRLLMKGKLDDAPTDFFTKPLSLGTYIVKITGKRNYTARIVNTGK